MRLTTLTNALPRLHRPLHIPSTTSPPCTRLTNLDSPSPTPLQPIIPNRTFTTTPHPLKKGNKHDSKRTVPLNAQPPTPTDPLDLADYTTAITHTHTTLKASLAKIKPGGLDPESIENIRVQLVKGSKDPSTVVKVGDIASVLVRGRNICILVAEKEHIKPLLSTLHSPPQNHNPTPSPTDPLTLLIPIPPTTQESRLAAQSIAGKRGEEALFALQEARGAQRKRLRGLRLGRVVGPDELRRAEKEMERVNGEAVGEAKRVVEGARRGLRG